MRPRALALGALVLAAAPLAAQPPMTPTTPPAQPTPPAPPAAQTPDPLDAYLAQWQQTMEGVQALSAALKRTDKDQVTDEVKEYSGYTKYLHVNSGGTTQNLAILEMTRKGDHDFSEKFVCSGGFIYQFIPSQKEIVAHEIPKPRSGQVSDDNFLSFLFGMKKEDARARYDMKLDKSDRHPDGTDANYVYVNISPRYASDQVDFKRAQIVLFKNSLLPRRLWFESNNSTETTWDVTEIKNNDTGIDRREFDAPTPPKDWKMITAPKDAETPPRVVRPNGS